MLASPESISVWYFFYGTLADPATLSRVLGYVHDSHCYKKASVRGGRLTTWGGKYKALVDEPTGGFVYGWAYLVKNAADEQALRVYDTANYEVVRCLIRFEDGPDIYGLTFRFVVQPGARQQ